MTYLAETVDVLVNRLSEKNDNLILACFMIYKVLWSIQKDIHRDSHYWQQLKMVNNDDQWDLILKS